ncbi:GumC family protein [Hwangdonia seohaensis]|uniref:non-specific protein-tyrosine kinase n=1 Tax=Hwangdonia seohaensis TaxID=1240727 RepID=A0ABW3RBG8_9FLAO|nr:polysaccharide biosynthesis tyrosine autokinase [Hwangdonia seohaensis]
MITNDNKIDNEIDSEGFNLKKTISIYVKQWKWFLLSILIFLFSAFIYLRYTTPEYAAYSKIMITSDSEGSSGAGAFKDLSIFVEKEEAAVEDEIQVIASRSFMQNIVKSLGLNVQYFTRGRIYESELYKSSPITIDFIATDSIISKTSYNFFIDITSETEFNYRVSEDDTPKKVDFGETIPTPFEGMIITPKTNVKKYVGKSIRVKLTPVESVSARLKRKISIEPYSKSSKVLIIRITDPVQSKAMEILDFLIEQYNISTLEKKNLKSINTAKLIDERVELIAEDLMSVDSSIVRFKTGNKITDVASEAGLFMSTSAQNEQQLDAAMTQMRLLNSVSESLNDDSFDAIPSNLGAGDPSISALSLKYNELIQRRKTLLEIGAGKKNQTVIQFEQSLNGIKQDLKNSVENSKKSYRIQLNSLENQSNRINSKITAVPGQQSKLRSIERKQGIKESIYLYLLQKREEAIISQTSTSPNLKVIDSAYAIGKPVFPDTKMIYIGAMFLGFLLPFGVIYVSDLLDTRIHNKEDLKRDVNNITILGEIPKIKANKVLVERNDRSILSESFRIIRTNFDYIKRSRKVDNYNNVVFVTSTINGEGKSFFSMNMALTLANTNKKVLLIGADIRNPKLLMGLEGKKKDDLAKVGLTEYLVDKSVTTNEAINTYEINGNKVDILLSGKVPPNPAELLMSDRMKPLFDEVSEQYDYVIVDTAPAMLVTDTLLFSQYAGHTIYLTRAGYTEKRILNFAKELHAERKLNGMMLVVNDVKQSNFGYGAQYGYYGAKEKKGFFRKRA